MTNPFPIERQTRQSSPMAGDGRATYGPFPFKIWDEDDILADVRRAGTEWAAEAVTVQKVAGQDFDNFTVTFSPALASEDIAVVRSRRLQERSSDVTRGAAISAVSLERELSIIATVLQELWRDLHGLGGTSGPGGGGGDGSPIAIGDVLGLPQALSGKSNNGHGHQLRDVSGLLDTLGAKLNATIFEGFIETRGEALGFATLGPDGILSASQRPPGSAIGPGSITDAEIFAPESPAAGINSGKVGFSRGVPAEARSALEKMGDHVSLRDFWNPSDAVNFTGTFERATAFCKANRKSLRIPAGIYETDVIPYGTMGYAPQFSIYGDGFNQTKVVKRAGSAGDLLTVGAATATNFVGNLVFDGFTLDANGVPSARAALFYDLVRSKLSNLRFTGGDIGYHMLGGIGVEIENVVSDYNRINAVFDKFASQAGGGWPNLITHRACKIVDATELGVYADNGALISFNGCDIEGNGTTFDAENHGGVIVGSNMGAETAIQGVIAHGLIFTDCWFEANRGKADLRSASGKLGVHRTRFFSSASQVRHDIQITGGQYSITESSGHFPKAENFKEVDGSALLFGNELRASNFAGISNYSAAKTTIYSRGRIYHRSGSALFAADTDQPLVQYGEDSSPSGSFITFPRPFKEGTTPRVFVQSTQNTESAVHGTQAFNFSHTGFSVRKVFSSSGGAISTGSFRVHWMAFGEAP